jgi:hypothetical protein
MTSLSKKPPVYKQKSHGIEVAVWKREHDGKAFYSISINRSYRDKDGDWQNSNSFNLEDRDILMDYLNRAFKDAQARLDADRDARSAGWPSRRNWGKIYGKPVWSRRRHPLAQTVVHRKTMGCAVWDLVHVWLSRRPSPHHGHL